MEGNRCVKPYVWCLIRQLGRAFPILLHSSIDKVKALAKFQKCDIEHKGDLWIQQVIIYPDILIILYIKMNFYT